MKIIITSPVQRDGKDLEIGEPIDIPKKDAQALIDVGAAELAGPKSKSPSQAADGASGETDPAKDGGDGGAGDIDPPADA